MKIKLSDINLLKPKFPVIDVSNGYITIDTGSGWLITTIEKFNDFMKKKVTTKKLVEMSYEDIADDFMDKEFDEYEWNIYDEEIEDYEYFWEDYDELTEEDKEKVWSLIKEKAEKKIEEEKQKEIDSLKNKDSILELLDEILSYDRGLFIHLSPEEIIDLIVENGRK